MTEEEWLTCDNPVPMLDFLTDKVGDRAMRLFACACCRSAWSLLVDERSRQAVEAAEGFIDGVVDDEGRRAAKREADEATREHWGRGERAALVAAAYAVEAAGRSRELYATDVWTQSAKDASYNVRAAMPNESDRQARLLREVVGPFPFRPVRFDRARLVSGECPILALARAAYEERSLPWGHLDVARLAVLSDALEEFGCDDAEILSHLRSPGPHVRGCWVVDLCLGLA